jgi:DNA-binding transcriptional LysR family regulator
MPQRIDWESQLGRRIRLRDLHVFTTAVRLGSMAKAAKELGVSQPAVSEVIADLEHMLRVRLLDRTPRGVEPTVYGSALLRRSVAAFDELRQGIRDIEFLSDPSAGELRISCPESIAAGYLQPLVARFAKAYPRVVLDVDTVNTQSFPPKLRDRSLDLVLARAGWPLDEPSLVEDFAIETVFDDKLVVAVGQNNPLARRKKLGWAELADQPWVLTGSDIWNYRLVAEAFRAHRLQPPKVHMKTLSVHLRASMAATRHCITTFPWSVLLFHEQLRLAMLPVDLPSRSWPIMAVTLRHRTPSPIVARFLESARAVSRSISARAPSRRN